MWLLSGSLKNQSPQHMILSIKLISKDLAPLQEAAVTRWIQRLHPSIPLSLIFLKNIFRCLVVSDLIFIVILCCCKRCIYLVFYVLKLFFSEFCSLYYSMLLFSYIFCPAMSIGVPSVERLLLVCAWACRYSWSFELGIAQWHDFGTSTAFKGSQVKSRGSPRNMSVAFFTVDTC